MELGPDPRRAAGDAVLAELVPGDPDAPDDTEVIRDGAALLLRRGRVLVRVRPEADLAVADRELRMAAVLESLSVPVTPLVERDRQPWSIDGQVVTAWRWSSGGGRVTAADLGHLARTLREYSALAGASVPSFLPIEAVLRAVAALPADDPDAAFVRGCAAELAEPWADAAAADPLGRSIVHGDLHRGNVVPGPAGPLLTDLELVGGGPSTYDVAPAVVAVERYGARPAQLADFIRAYGYDPRPWPGFATFVAVYELWVTAWAVGVRHQDPTWATEASRRIATLRDGADHTWTLS